MAAITDIGDLAAAGQPLRAVVHDSIARAETAWRRLQQDGGYGPHQRLPISMQALHRTPISRSLRSLSMTAPSL